MGNSAIIDSIRAAAVPQTADSMELYRRQLLVPSGSAEPPVRISFLDVHPRDYNQTLVLLHGFAANSAWWRPQLPALAQKNRIIVIDARGNGLSAHSEKGNTVEQQGDDVISILDDLGVVEPIIAAGHSTGGFVATDLALRYRERVKKLILVATPYTFAGSSTLRIARIFMSFPDFFFRVGQYIYELDPRGQASILGLKRLFKDSLVNWDGSEKYPHITQPTLVIEGQRDSLFPPESYQRVVEAIPKSSLVEIGVSKHQVTLERPKAVLRAMQRFIDPESPFRPPWRSENDEIEIVRLLARRPWIALYEGNMPPELMIPRIPLNNIMAYAARQFGKQKAILSLNEGKDQKFTYEELSLEIANFRAALVELGVDKGSHIFIMMKNMPQLIMAFYATIGLGATAVLANPQDSQLELLRQADETNATLLVTSEDQEKLAQLLKSNTLIREVIYVSEDDYHPDQMLKRQKAGGKITDDLSQKEHRPGGGLRWINLREKHQAPQEIFISATADDIAAIMFTSGQNRKAVPLSHENLVAGSLQMGAWLSNLDYGQSSILSAIPFTDAYGLLMGVNVAVHKAAQIHIPDSFDPLNLLRIIKKHQPSIVLGTPALYRALNQIVGLENYLPKRRPLFLSSGAPLPVEVEEAFERLSRSKLLELYGMVESGYVACVSPINRDRTGSVGLPLPNCDLQIADLNSGQPLPFGQIGELQIRGPQVAVEPQKEVQLPDDAGWDDAGWDDAGWINTGDLAEMDDDGYFRIIGRCEDILTRNGIAIYPRDIEESILEMPEVDDVAALIVDGKIVIFICPLPKVVVSDSDITDFCLRRLPATHQPDRIHFLPAIPRDFKGRLYKADLLKNQQSR